MKQPKKQKKRKSDDKKKVEDDQNDLIAKVKKNSGLIQSTYSKTDGIVTCFLFFQFGLG